MENMVLVELLVEKTIADEIMQKKIAEVALRRIDAKFREMVKCPVIGEPVSNGELLKKITANALEVVNNQNHTLAEVSKEIKNVGIGLNRTAFQLSNLTEATKNLSIQVDGIYQAANVIRSVSFMNLGLSLINIGVNVIGLVIIGKKINELSNELMVIESKLDKIADVQIIEIISEFELLNMNSQTTLMHIEDGIISDVSELENIIPRLRAYMNEIVRLMNRKIIDIETAMKIIYVLSPAYIAFIKEYVKLYYFKAGKCPDTYRDYLAFFQLFIGDDFLIKMQDYYYLEHNYSGRDTLNILNAQILLALNAYTTVEDQVLLLNTLGSKEKYLEFDKELDNCAENLLLDHIDEIAEKSGIDKDTCLELIVDNGKKIA